MDTLANVNDVTMISDFSTIRSILGPSNV